MSCGNWKELGSHAILHMFILPAIAVEILWNSELKVGGGGGHSKINSAVPLCASIKL